MATIFTNTKERVLKIAEFKGISKEKFFSDMGLSYGNFKGKAKQKSLSSDALATIITNHKEFNVEWLLTGKGDMKKGYKNNEDLKGVAEEETHYDTTIKRLEEKIDTLTNITINIKNQLK
jgi:hypothetical protein